MGRKIVIGGAWPYANSSLHLGHLAGLISGDVLARFHRQYGDDVIYVSGTDCHGTPITERAKKEGITPKDIAEKYHKEFSEVFKKMNFSYNLYTKTESEFHKEEVKKLFRRMYDNGYIYEKIEPDTFCKHCNKFVSDRELKLICPVCENETKGDQCDCGHILTIEELDGATCVNCGNKVVLKDNKNLYIALGKLQPQIEEYVEKNKNHWRKNAQNETEKYLREGLRERAVTRDLDWGIEIPVEGYENKKMYVWIDAVLGYLTTTMNYCKENGLNWEEWWKDKSENAKIYMVHGKDNITFHSLILPGLLLATEDGYRLPDMIVSTEYLNFNDQKFSKSKGIGMTILEAINEFNIDTLRFYLIKNGPEKKDSNFSVEDYTAHHNEITNKLGNFVNRTLKYKGIEEIPNGEMDKQIKEKIEKLYKEIPELMEKLEFREVSNKIMNLLEDANKYYDEQKPWIKAKEDINSFNNIIFTCSNIIANISNLFEPFMPETTEKIRKILEIEKPTWEYIEAKPHTKLENVEVLFTRM